MENEKFIPVAEPDLTGREIEYVVDAIQNEGRISSSGKYLDYFEEQAKKIFKREYAVSCSNGTVALKLALQALGIGPGDEVVVPAFTFGATAACVVHVGATPVFIDSNPEDWNLDVAKLSEVLTERTKAVIAVDIYGIPCEYDAIERFCKEHGLFLIEDAAEAHGAAYKDRPVGSIGDISCFSFYGNKIITTGEGGMCLADDAGLAEKMRVLKNHGMPKPGVYDYDLVGHNYRLTNVQAAIGSAQLERLEEFMKVRREHDVLYRSILGSSDRITFQKYDEKDIAPANWLFSFLIDENSKGLRDFLLSSGIGNRPLFKPLNLQTVYSKYAGKGSFKVAESLYERGLSVPSSVKLKDEEIRYICGKILEYLKTN